MKTTTPKALTIDPIYAWAMLHCGKRLENRSWRTSFRGPLLLHAGQNRSREASGRAFLQELGYTPPPSLDRLRGKFFAVCELADCLPIGDSLAIGDDPWAVGRWCWKLERLVRLPVPLVATGRQSLWTPQEAVAHMAAGLLAGQAA